jgi:hypothetical protein
VESDLRNCLTALGFVREGAYAWQATIGQLTVVAVSDGGDRLILSAADTSAVSKDPWDFVSRDFGWTGDEGELIQTIRELHFEIFGTRA